MTMSWKKALAAAVAALAMGAWTAPHAFAQAIPAQVHLPGNKIPQFAAQLPVLDLDLATPTGIKTVIAGDGEITLNMLEFKANMMPSTFVPANGPYTGTWTFGYLVGPTTAPASAVETPVGPVIVATRGLPTQVRYVNNLTTQGIAWRDWIDQSLHSAFHQIYGDPMPMLGDAARYLGPVPAVPHLHGGEDPAVIDGGPEAYFLSNVGDFTGVVATQGAAYYTHPGVPAAAHEAVYRYPNSQEAAPLWFHDHLLGGTRINATFAGLAGAYPVIEPIESSTLPAGLDPVGLGGRLLIPLVIQDRMFDTNGQLFFPNVGVNPEHPIWVPEFVGDTIIVNGKVWPFLDVDRQRYRFYLIDGSNSRAYDMFLQDLTSGVKGPRMWVIATDGGYLDRPVMIDPNATGAQVKAGVKKSLLMMPGERYEIIVDFNDPVWLAAINAAYAAMVPPVPVPDRLNLVLRNTAPTVDGNPKASLDGRIMQFRVSANTPVDASYNPDPTAPGGGQPLRPAMVRLADPVAGTLGAGVIVSKTRQLTLNEVVGAGGPLEALVNNSKWSGLRPDGITPIPGSTPLKGLWLTELPVEGETEVWEFVNLTADAHPIHLHGVQFQIMNRQAFDPAAFNAVYDPLFPGRLFIGGYGPPLAYDPADPAYDPLLQGGKFGGNPDVTPFLLGAAVPPAAYEAGWKDTAIMPSGEVTRIVARFAPQHVAAGAVGSFTFNPSAADGYYVWHCHITDHEDNEMMRPYQFQPNIPDASRTYVQGTDY